MNDIMISSSLSDLFNEPEKIIEFHLESMNSPISHMHQANRVNSWQSRTCRTDQCISVWHSNMPWMALGSSRLTTPNKCISRITTASKQNITQFHCVCVRECFFFSLSTFCCCYFALRTCVCKKFTCRMYSL